MTHQPVPFLAAVAAYAIDGLDPVEDQSRAPEPVAVPLSAAKLLRRWLGGTDLSIDDAHAGLVAAAASPDRVFRSRRAIPIALASLPAALAVAGTIAIVPAFQAATSPDLFEMYRLLAALPSADATSQDRVRSLDHERDIELYLAGRFRRELTDDRYWNESILQAELASLRPVAMRVAAAHPNVTPEELQRATHAVDADRARIAHEYGAIGQRRERSTVVMIVAIIGIAAGFSFACSLLSVLIAPGSLLLRLLGLAVVNRRGVEIGRARAIWRVLLGWSPLLAPAIWIGPSPVSRLLDMAVSPTVLIAVVLAVTAAGAVWTIVCPTRGPHDWIAATRVVPR